MGIAASSGRVGYVLLVGRKLYTWQLSKKAAETPEEATRLTRLWIGRTKPDVVVMEKITEGCRKGKRTKVIIETIADVVANMELYDISVLRPRNFSNKYAEAAALADRFPDLKPRLPHGRKVWDSEPRNTTIFEALALALVVIDREPG
ncbi:hypothetical protein [Rhizobium sp. LjRoot254]|uniref:hypothetical protein n=1 Tax=Rhizobium sp. LjRoot254 TaxID=3342297 RepID=UPI003ECF966F